MLVKLGLKRGAEIMLINNDLSNKALKNDVQLQKTEKKTEQNQLKHGDNSQAVITNDIKIKSQSNYNVTLDEANDILKSVQGNLSSFSTSDANELLGSGLNNIDVLALLKEN